MFKNKSRQAVHPANKEPTVEPTGEIHKVSNNTVEVTFENSEEERRKLKLEMTRRSLKDHKKWVRRLKILFCCLGYKKNKDSIADVASIFAEFYADLDVPSSDIAAGFVLLSKYQAAQRQWIVNNQQSEVEQYLSSIPITQETHFLDISTAEDSHLINDLIYYMNYSLAVFGWPLHMLYDPCMLCCICPYLKLSPCCSGGRKKKLRKPASSGAKEDKSSKGKSENAEETNEQNKNNRKDKKSTKLESKDANNNNDNSGSNDNEEEIIQNTCSTTNPGQLNENCDQPTILHDNCCACNVASVERRLVAHNYEMIYASYKVNVNVVPFLVAADHSKQTIVVAIRGSMSLSDMITDLNGQMDKLPIENCPDDWLCHRGITRAACYVKATLLEEHILDRAFNCRPDLGTQDYTLVLCGHSLGAGVAAILGIIMRPMYPTLRSYLYSPPGGALSLPAVEYTKEFATGIILGNDCVPRLGVAQLERLRYYVLLSLKSSENSTGKILTKALCPCFGSNKVDYDPEQSLNLLHGTEGRSFDYNGSKIPFQVQPQVLYVPGKLIHIVKNHSFKSKARRLFREPIYQAVWVDNTIYDRVMIGEGMFYDHLPNQLMYAMKMLFSKTLPARRELSRENSNLPQEVQCETTSESQTTCNQASKQPSSLENHGVVVESGDSKVEVDLRDDNNNFKTEEDSVRISDENNNNGPQQVGVVDQNHIEHSKLSHSGEFNATINRESKPSLDSNGNDETTVNNNH